jgi:hypothetical protein
MSGYRPNGGRPKKDTSKQKTPHETPLEYMLRVMNDNGADISRRDRMAIAAAPFVHGRAIDLTTTKKAQRSEAAKTAAEKFTVPAAPPRLVVNR